MKEHINEEVMMEAERVKTFAEKNLKVENRGEMRTILGTLSYAQFNI